MNLKFEFDRCDSGVTELQWGRATLLAKSGTNLPFVSGGSISVQRPLMFLPGPVCVPEEVLAAMATPMIDHRGPAFAKLLGRITEKIRPIFGTKHEVLFLGSSGTGGLEAAVTSTFSPGQKVLSCPIGVFGRRLAAIARAFGLEVETVACEDGAVVDPRVLAARLVADRKREIAGIFLTDTEASTGARQDMAALARAIGDHPATTIVDSVSGFGAQAFRMDEWGFDIVVTSSQKVLALSPGVAAIAVSPRAWQRIAVATGPRFALDLHRARKFSMSGETPWTPPISLNFALDVALERYHAEGAPSVWERYERNAEAIHAFAAAAGLTPFSAPGAHAVTVTALCTPAGIVAGNVLDDLRIRHGVIFGSGQEELKGKMFRVGTMGAITPEGLIEALDRFEAVLINHGHPAVRGSGAAAARSVLERRGLCIREENFVA
ncbi:MAG TPA: alanine--glyoxylate aminotransferase family protein [Candidatus Baltobacteraceae bacterium]|jgi:aspartate aminotransferase-like enzyme|nr:alanine--glyoxylate aminotransferase family protein [Candidatus Baltobacteraceae bacterium]